jgi:hypothetical protein
MAENAQGRALLASAHDRGDEEQAHRLTAVVKSSVHSIESSSFVPTTSESGTSMKMPVALILSMEPFFQAALSGPFASRYRNGV